MSSPSTKLALWFSLFLATNGAAGAQQVVSGPADQLCGPDQLSGQYECVTSVPLSEEEVWVSLAYLAAIEFRDDKQPAPGVIVDTPSVRTIDLASGGMGGFSNVP